MTRFPLQDLIDLISCPNEVENQLANLGRNGTETTRHLLELLRISSHTFRRGMVEGVLAYHADIYAVRAGYHPIQVWPHWPGQLPDCEQCGEPFMPVTSRNRFCSRSCGIRKRAMSPVGATA